MTIPVIPIYQRFPNDPLYLAAGSGDGSSGNPFVLNVEANGPPIATPYSFTSAGGSNQDSQVVKNAAGTVYNLIVSNINAAARYLKVYDKATGPTSADTPVLTVTIPGNTAGSSVLVNPTVGLSFLNGISFRMTTGVAANDTGAVAAGDVVVSLGYV